MLGPAMVAGWVVWRWPGRMTAVAGCLLVAVMAGRSFFAAQNWQDGVTLFAHALRVNPMSWPAHNNLAVELETEGRVEEAAEHYRLGAIAGYKQWRNHYNLAVCYYRLGRTSEASQAMARAIRLVSELQLKTGQDIQGAREQLAWVLSQQGDYDGALAQTDVLFKTSPDSAMGWYVRGYVAFRQNRMEDALRDMGKAVSLQPDLSIAYRFLGEAARSKGDLLQRSPRRLPPWGLSSWSLATVRPPLQPSARH
jgi:tetratricopeptide (TPR) repeat protein